MTPATPPISTSGSTSIPAELRFPVVSAEEIVVPHLAPQAQVPLVTSVRGTVIVASLRGLRSRGYGEQYMEALEPRFRDTVASLTAATWLPIDFGIAHYEACDRLDLDRTTIEEIGAESARFINETILSVVVKLSTQSGVTPWFCLSYANKLCTRTWVGSSFAGFRVGPKEARLEWIQQPAARYRYFRMAFGAFSAAICRLFAQTLYVREMPNRSSNTSVSYRISWV